ncbi:hypothetical protein YSY43_17520 [Paenibacillus sp. YSY-4.3]
MELAYVPVRSHLDGLSKNVCGVRNVYWNFICDIHFFNAARFRVE